MPSRWRRACARRSTRVRCWAVTWRRWPSLRWDRHSAHISPRRGSGEPELEWRAILYGILLVGVSVVVWKANIQPIQADVIYKQGLRYDAALEWEQAAAAYELASAKAPYEDYYLLFAGRASLEQARAATDAAQRDELFEVAIARLEQARALSPLNTDHAANLARAYRSWAEADPESDQDSAARTALEYYAQAVALSPQNAQLYNEWGMTYAALGNTAQARARYEESLALDDRYAMTYLLLGDLYLDRGSGQRRFTVREGHRVDSWLGSRLESSRLRLCQSRALG